MMSNHLIFLGLAITLIGLALLVAGIIYAGFSVSDPSKSKFSAGGVIFLGPIPLVFGSDRNTAYMAAVVGLVLMLAYYFFLKR